MYDSARVGDIDNAQGKREIMIELREQVSARSPPPVRSSRDVPYWHLFRASGLGHITHIINSIDDVRFSSKILVGAFSFGKFELLLRASEMAFASSSLSSFLPLSLSSSSSSCVGVSALRISRKGQWRAHHNCLRVVAHLVPVRRMTHTRRR